MPGNPTLSGLAPSAAFSDYPLKSRRDIQAKDGISIFLELDRLSQRDCPKHRRTGIVPLARRFILIIFRGE
jgi:hypothetical protein